MPAEVLEQLKPAPVTPSPAAIPSPAAGGTPAAAPASPTPPAAGDAGPYDEVDRAFTKAGMPDPDKAKAESKVKETPPAKDTKPAAPAKPIPTAADKAPGVPKELRAELDRVKSELKTKSESYAALEAKIKDYESKGKDTEALVAQLDTERKEKDKLKADLRRAKKETDPNFVKNYETPYQETADEAKATISTIQVEDPESGAVRAGKWEDFVRLYGYNEFLATKEAKRLFGEDGAPVAMRYYMELHRLDKIKTKALNEVHAKWKEEETAEQAKAAEAKVKEEKHQEEVNAFWTKTNADLAEKVEDYHDAPDAEKELSETRNKALSAYDAQPKTLKERIIKDAHNRQRVAAFPVLKMKLERALKELAEVKAEIEGLKESPPGKTNRPGGSPAGTHEETLEEALRKIQ